MARFSPCDLGRIATSCRARRLMHISVREPFGDQPLLPAFRRRPRNAPLRKLGSRPPTAGGRFGFDLCISDGFDGGLVLHGWTPFPSFPGTPGSRPPLLFVFSSGAFFTVVSLQADPPPKVPPGWGVPSGEEPGEELPHVWSRPKVSPQGRARRAHAFRDPPPGDAPLSRGDFTPPPWDAGGPLGIGTAPPGVPGSSG